MKLLLTANGLSNPTLEQAFSELTNNKAKLRVALVQTAGDPIEWVQDKDNTKKFTPKLTKQNKIEDNQAYKDYVAKGYEVVDADLKQDPDVLKEKLQNVDVIDVGGGDVDWLLEWAKKSKLDTYLKEILERGVVYLGASAGSMLLNPDIGFTWWEPGSDLDRVGLGIADFMFQPLHGGNDEEKTKKWIERKKYLQSIVSYPWPVYLVGDGQALKVMDGKVEHIGPGLREVI